MAELPTIICASDSNLARRLAAGDREAEAELFRRLAPRVRLIVVLSFYADRSSDQIGDEFGPECRQRARRAPPRPRTAARVHGRWIVGEYTFVRKPPR